MTQAPDPQTDLKALEILLGHDEEGAKVTPEADPALAEAMDFWSGRFAPLLSIAEPVPPSDELWQRIARSTIGARQEAPAPKPERRSWLASLWESAGFWRLAAASAIAGLLLFVVFGPVLRPPTAPAFIAVLQNPEQPGDAGWLVEVAGDRSVKLLPLGESAPPENNVFQFWTLWDKQKGPVSLGLVPHGAVTRIEPGVLPTIVPGQIFEITLEPAGGSPTGRPTGRVLYKGLTVAAPPPRGRST